MHRNLLLWRCSHRRTHQCKHNGVQRISMFLSLPHSSVRAGNSPRNLHAAIRGTGFNLLPSSGLDSGGRLAEDRNLG